MTRLERLKREAKSVAQWRGHALGGFATVSPTDALAECPCGAYVMVRSHPMPNEIDIGGDAVALTHPVSK